MDLQSDKNNRHFLSDPASRVWGLKTVVAAGFIAGLLFSTRLWAGARLFPRAPALDCLPPMPPALEAVLFLLLIGLLAAVIVSPKPRKLIFLALGVAATLAFFDQMRWQPWVYQYCAMLAALGVFSWDPDDIRGRQALLNTLRLIVAATYFYSGLQKINPVFIGGTFPWMVGPVAGLFPGSIEVIILSSGIFVPALEMGIGLGLLSQRYRRCAVVCALLMLVLILFLLGPLGHVHNSVVWPWNIAMAFFIVVLFGQEERFSFQEFWQAGNFQRAVFILFAVMPAFSFCNLWDSYLSSSLYSGSTNRAQIYVSNSVKQKLPEAIQVFVRKTKDRGNRLDLMQWSYDDLNVPPYPETRIYKVIAKDVCKYADGGRGVLLVVQGRPTLFNGDRGGKYDCDGL